MRRLWSQHARVLWAQLPPLLRQNDPRALEDLRGHPLPDLRLREDNPTKLAASVCDVESWGGAESFHQTPHWVRQVWVCSCRCRQRPPAGAEGGWRDLAGAIHCPPPCETSPKRWQGGTHSYPAPMRAFKHGGQRLPRLLILCPSFERSTGIHGGRNVPNARTTPLCRKPASVFGLCVLLEEGKNEMAASRARCQALQQWRHPHELGSAATRQVSGNTRAGVAHWQQPLQTPRRPERVP